MLILLADSMERSPSWEANSHSSSHEIPHLLWNQKVQYRVHICPPLLSILSHMHPVLTFPPYFAKVHSDVFVQSTLMTPYGLFPSVFRPKFCIFFSNFSMRAACPVHLILLGSTTLVISGEAYTLRETLLISLLQLPATSLSEVTVVLRTVEWVAWWFVPEFVCAMSASLFQGPQNRILMFFYPLMQRNLSLVQTELRLHYYANK
jgi:hypothetical protein